jgi:hypothetical protein
MLKDDLDHLLANLCTEHGIFPFDGVPLVIAEEFNALIGDALAQMRAAGKIGNYEMIATRDGDKMNIEIRVDAIGKIEKFDVECGVGVI